MKHPTLKCPEFLEVRGRMFALLNPPLYWSENRHHELSCNKCQQLLVVLFAAREEVGVTRADPRWWVPTALTCSCLLPRSIQLHEIYHKPRAKPQDKRQLEFIAKDQNNGQLTINL
jgi:hypothetical protein